MKIKDEINESDNVEDEDGDEIDESANVEDEEKKVDENVKHLGKHFLIHSWHISKFF